MPQQAVDWNGITTGANTFNNYGAVQATGNDAVRPDVNGVVNNYAGGNIISANTTVAAAVNAGNGPSSNGIDALTNSGVKITNTGTIQSLNSINDTSDGVTVGGTINNSGTNNGTGTVNADSSGLAIDMGGGNNALNVTGGGAAINGNVSGGTGGTNTLAITPGAGHTFSYSGSFSNFAAVSIGNSQTGADGQTNFAGGRVVLSGASAYAGTTTVYNGATLVANTPVATGSATGSGAVSVHQGGGLAGNGNVAGTVTLVAGANLSPGDGGAGTPRIGGSLNATDGSTFTYDIGDTQLHSDQLTLAGTMTFTGPGHMTSNIVSNGIGTGTFDLIDLAGGHLGFDTSNLQFGTVPAGSAGTFTLMDNSLLLNITAVPEPGTVAWTIGVVGLLVVGGWRKSRRVCASPVPR